MLNWDSVTINIEAQLGDAISKMETNGAQVVLIVEGKKLLGTVTDGDIRRGLLKNLTMEASIGEIMNSTPYTIGENASQDDALALMKEFKIHQIPKITAMGELLDLFLLDDLVAPQEQDAIVVIMAGGLGKRLRPLTENTPKPLLHVGGKPLVQTIIERFREYGFKNVYLSVNYKAEQFIAHFGDGGKLGLNIEYIHETQPLGTAGSLSLLPKKPTVPLIIMNGDLLTSVNFAEILKFHKKHNAKATMCVREYSFHVPYGVIENDGHKLTRIVEKPSHDFFVNAGIYVIDPDMLEHIPNDHFFDMPDLFNTIIHEGLEAAVFPIREYWTDIGHLEDFEKARRDYSDIF